MYKWYSYILSCEIFYNYLYYLLDNISENHIQSYTLLIRKKSFVLQYFTWSINCLLGVMDIIITFTISSIGSMSSRAMPTVRLGVRWWCWSSIRTTTSRAMVMARVRAWWWSSSSIAKEDRNTGTNPKFGGIGEFAGGDLRGIWDICWVSC